MLNMMVGQRWYYPDNMELSPLKGAMVLAAGWKEFRRDCIKELQAVQKRYPGIIGREDWSDVVNAIWRRLHLKLWGWSLAQVGRRLSPRETIAAFERTYREPEKPKPIDEQRFTFRDGGRNTNARHSGWKSSGDTRTGTLKEIASDLVSEEYRKIVVDAVDDARRRQKGDA